MSLCWNTIVNLGWPPFSYEPGSAGSVDYPLQIPPPLRRLSSELSENLGITHVALTPGRPITWLSHTV